MDKTEYMVIGSKQKILNTQQETTIKLQDKELKQVNCTKTLGIIVDENNIIKVSQKSLFLNRLCLMYTIPRSSLF